VVGTYAPQSRSTGNDGSSPMKWS